MSAPRTAPCNPWIVPDDVTACCPGLKPDVDLTLPIAFASNILYKLSGRRYSGICTKTVWPPCPECTRGSEWWRFAASDWANAGTIGSGYPSLPYPIAGGWANCWSCGNEFRGSPGMSCIDLPGPINDVVEIVIAGAVLDPNLYVVHNRRQICRVDGGIWPHSNPIVGQPVVYNDPVYSLTINAASGSYALSVALAAGTATIHVSATASAATLEAALVGIVGAGNATVTGGPGDVGGTTPYVIVLHARGLGEAPAITAVSETLAGGTGLTIHAVDKGSAPPAGSWYITTEVGTPVPVDGQVVAAILACQFAKNRCGATGCVLPQRLKEISREGELLAFTDPLTFLDEGKVGIYEVDLWLGTVNPRRLQRRSAVYRADAHAAPRRFE